MKRLATWIIASLLAFTLGSAMADDTVLGAGDMLKISVYGSPDLSLETRVSEAGSITFPLLGPVTIGGLSAAFAEKKIGGMLEAGGFIRKAQVNIIVTLTQSAQVSVLGQVVRPGRYPLDGKRSLMDILALAGGMSGEGGDTIVLIRKRNGVATKDVIDIIQMIRTGVLTQDFDLAGNDVLYVERAPKFYIYGEVQHPGSFRLERSMTVIQALSVGGGLTARGTERGMSIKRRDAAGKLQVVDAKLDDLVKVDDVVYVKESVF